jgi:hypothetical protein
MRTTIFILLSCLLSFSCTDTKKEKKIPVKEDVKPDSSLFIKNNNPVNPYDPVDVSPMDMSYYPVDYPKLKMANPNIAPPLARIIYSRPHLGGRRLFQNLLKYNEPWRLGANEATEIDLYKDATIQDKKIKAGRYVLYCIPEKEKWTIVLNSNIDSWGLHPDASSDIARFIIPVTNVTTSIEYFTIVFQQKKKGAELLMAWDYLEARLPISF